VRPVAVGQRPFLPPLRLAAGLEPGYSSSNSPGWRSSDRTWRGAAMSARI
jgi:hypothetical protein